MTDNHSGLVVLLCNTSDLMKYDVLHLFLLSILLHIKVKT